MKYMLWYLGFKQQSKLFFVSSWKLVSFEDAVNNVQLVLTKVQPYIHALFTVFNCVWEEENGVNW